MSEKNYKKAQTIHVSFSPEELAKLDERVKKTGLSRTAFVHDSALKTKIKGYDMAPLLEHSMAIGNIAQLWREIKEKEHKDRWLYESDLDRIEKSLKQLVDSEAYLIQTMVRRLRR